MSQQHTIEIDRLSFAYGKDGPLFQNLNLDLTPGSVYGLLGRNGTGKTTLLRILAGLLAPKSGACRVFDFEARSRAPGLLSDIYFLAEEMHAPPLSAQAYAGLYAPFYPRFDMAAFSHLLAELSLEPEMRLSELSYGQRKKFFIAFGLATGARLLIFDEPTNGLDIPAKSQFRKLLVSAIDPERVIIISTHQVRDIQNLIDPVLILDAGRVVFHQTMERVNAKLAVRLAAQEPEPGSCLYYERTIGGYAVLFERDAPPGPHRSDSFADRRGSGDIELELLFNAVLQNKERFDSIFATEEFA